MSVAFRREDDDAHLEPSFELPIPPGPNLVTARGKALIDGEVARLEAEARAAAGDEEALKRVARDLRYWQTRQVTAEVQPEAAGDVVAFGTRVAFTLAGKRRTLALVGDDEADPAAGLVAFSAPLARAMMGAEPGDLVDFNGREEAIEVLEVAPI